MLIFLPFLFRILIFEPLFDEAFFVATGQDTVHGQLVGLCRSCDEGDFGWLQGQLEESVPFIAAIVVITLRRHGADNLDLAFVAAKELVELDIEARKAGLEKCLKLFQTISDTPSNDIQIRQIEQATQLYKALTNGPCY